MKLKRSCSRSLISFRFMNNNQRICNSLAVHIYLKLERESRCRHFSVSTFACQYITLVFEIGSLWVSELLCISIICKRRFANELVAIGIHQDRKVIQFLAVKIGSCSFKIEIEKSTLSYLTGLVINNLDRPIWYHDFSSIATNIGNL